MSWIDTLRPASFKGLEFKVEGHETEVGRRTVTNEYAYRDTPWTEDMGRKARRYRITAYLVGTDYTTQRDAIMDAVEAGGAGTLIHPYLGTKQVNCENLRVREVRDEGGFVVLSFNFVEAGQRIFPNSDPEPVALVEQSADEMIIAARDRFIEQMEVLSVPEWIRTEFGDTLGNAADMFNTIRINGGINKQTTTDLINQAAVWAADVAGLQVPSLSLIQDIPTSADMIISVMKGVFDLAPTPTDAVNNLDDLAEFEAVTVGGESLQGQIATSNQQASQEFIQSVALSTQAKALVNVDFPSYEDAIAGRKTILDRLDSVMANTTSDTIYTAARALRADVAQAVPGENESLPRISNYSLKQSLPTLVLAYDLYEGVDKEQDIIDRNKIRHPAFMPGGQKLSVLEYEQS